jgi:Fe-S-cluster-containing hydrogenase component 2
MSAHTPRILLLYHSASGNTAWVADQLARALLVEQIELIPHSIVEPLDPAAIGQYRLIGFGCPVMAFQPSFSMAALISSLPLQSSKPAFFFLTYSAVLANSPWQMGRLLQARGFTTMTYALFPAEVSWPMARALGIKLRPGRPDGHDSVQVQRLARSLAAGLRQLSPGAHVTSAEAPCSFYNPFFLISRLTRPLALRLLMGSKRIDQNTCTRCGLCRDLCAAHAIQLDPYPVFSSRCNGCWGCYNICPAGAIRASAGTAGRYRACADVLIRLRHGQAAMHMITAGAHGEKEKLR